MLATGRDTHDPSSSPPSGQGGGNSGAQRGHQIQGHGLDEGIPT